ncbi:MAG TPA: tRNA 2-thiouridine(34) synthase MnmA [Candidatus Paceibacterota bacterium]
MANEKKIFVGLSGGVDSSVAAFLLCKQGYAVTGVFIKVWQPDFLTCTWQDDRQDAMRVCAHLGIPFKTLDLSDVYKKNVVDYMIAEYKKGHTPNPDVMCNRSVKFGAFLQFAKEEGARAVATGHYAQIKQHENHATLWSSKDLKKDQTYFLWQLAQRDLSSVMFPIGHLRKEETRRIAARAGLITATKRDSQGLCFLGKLDMKDFLRHFIKEKQGDVVLTTGEVVGKHRGVLFYTLGERHGFTLETKETRGPYYVVEKDNKRNRLIVDREPLSPKAGKKLDLINVNWIGEPPKPEYLYRARIRHGGALFPVTVGNNSSNGAHVTFSRTSPLTARGQSVVLYEEYKSGLRCIGGGFAQ